MSETKQVAEMAQRVSKDVFGVFGWTQAGPEDVDWECANQNAHEVKTHPSDLVMWYDDPYASVRNYFNFDLKSYSVGSLKKPTVRKAITSLCKATDCANVSGNWSSLYGSEANYHVHGLLFVYNHDGHYDGDFDTIAHRMDNKDLPLAPLNRVHILSPESVNYLATIATDMEKHKARLVLSEKPFSWAYHYPDLVGIHPKHQNNKIASIEMLQNPWQIVRTLKPTGGAALAVEYLVYYRGEGGTVDEFKYMIDAFFRYQMLGDEELIVLKIPFAHKNHSAAFQQARDAYAADFYGVGDFKKRLGRIRLEPIQNVTQNFSTIQLGMDYDE